MKRLTLLAVLSVSGCIIDDGADGPSGRCGDGVVSATEQCDDGNTTPGDGCSAMCSREVVCGDGVTTPPTEQCDDGNTTPGDGCSATCTQEGPVPRCGDGIVNQASEQCDDGNQINGDGCSAMCKQESAGDAFISATWTLKNTATNTTTGCPVGYNTAALYAQPVNAMGQTIGPPYIDLFTCSASSGTAAAVPPALYRVWIEIVDQNNTMLYAKSLSAIVDVTFSDKTFNTQILNDGGYFQLAWVLRGAVSNNVLTCAQAGAAGLETVGTDVSNPTSSLSDIWNCTDGSGITADYLAGTYTVSVAALNAMDQSIGTAPALTNRVIQDRNRLTDLGTVTVPITGL